MPKYDSDTVISDCSPVLVVRSCVCLYWLWTKITVSLYFKQSNRYVWENRIAMLHYHDWGRESVVLLNQQLYWLILIWYFKFTKIIFNLFIFWTARQVNTLSKTTSSGCQCLSSFFLSYPVKWIHFIHTYFNRWST